MTDSFLFFKDIKRVKYSEPNSECTNTGNAVQHVGWLLSRAESMCVGSRVALTLHANIQRALGKSVNATEPLLTPVKASRRFLFLRLIQTTTGLGANVSYTDIQSTMGNSNDFNAKFQCEIPMTSISILQHPPNLDRKIWSPDIANNQRHLNTHLTRSTGYILVKTFFLKRLKRKWMH